MYMRNCSRAGLFMDVSCVPGGARADAMFGEAKRPPEDHAGGPGRRARVPGMRFGSSVVAAEDAQQAQEVNEDVVEAQVDRQGGGDVVGFATVDDPLYVIEQPGREDADGHYRQGEVER